MEYKTKPVEIEAIEYTITNWRSVLKFVGENNLLFSFYGNSIYVRKNPNKLDKDKLRFGDFVVKDKDGLITVIDPITFNKTYELIGD